MPTLSTKRKQSAAPFKTSALESARRAGIAGAFAGPPDLAANRKKYLKARRIWVERSDTHQTFIYDGYRP